MPLRCQRPNRVAGVGHCGPQLRHGAGCRNWPLWLLWLRLLRALRGREEVLSSLLSCSSISDCWDLAPLEVARLGDRPEPREELRGLPGFEPVGKTNFVTRGELDLCLEGDRLERGEDLADSGKLVSIRAWIWSY